MRYLVVNETGYGMGDTVREAIDAYREAVRPGCWVECWRVGIAPEGDGWVGLLGGFDTRMGGDPVIFDLDLR